jgi:D-inositol-3-phosphate glycosyltransferase
LEDAGWDLLQLARYYGVLDQMIFTGGRGNLAFNPQGRMKLVYSALDVQISTGHGEGWGLTHMEGMACGTPQLLPDYSALAEWASGVAMFVPCTDFEATFSQINTIGGTVNKDLFIAALDQCFTTPDMLKDFGARGHALVQSEEYSWQSVGDRFNDELGRLL